ncbi:methyltransferase [Streptomyces sp. ICBB 8177]|nr:methyltransferase [Streptomyces sp. ICBB 8177]
MRPHDGGVRTDRWAHTADALRTRLVRRITDSGRLADPAWRAAFEAVPRHLFVPCYFRPLPGGAGYDRLAADDPDARRRTRWLAGAYEDAPLVTRVSGGRLVSSSSQPSLMAMMLEALEVREGHRVLEIGAGTGYNAALLAHRLGPEAVTTVDLDPEITDAAREHLAAAGFVPRPDGPGTVAVVTGDGALGCPERGPYDRIIATCELAAVPAPWTRQCAPGGVVLAPLASGLIALRVAGRGRAWGRFLDTPACFVALRGPGAHVPPPVVLGDGERVRRTGTPPAVLDDDSFRFLLTLAVGELDVNWAYGGRGVALSAGDGATARADRDGTVHLAGPYDLWTEVERCHALWREAGMPGRERFGLTVEGDRQWAWLDDPDGPHTWELTGRG